MGDKTRIPWADASWNCFRGCTQVSQGCTNCYAMRMAARFSGEGDPYEGLALFSEETRAPHWTNKVRLVTELLDQPIRWRRPRRIFVNSMSDLFHEQVTDDQLAAVFGVMMAVSWHTFLVLTKRPERMQRWISSMEEHDPFNMCWEEAEELLPPDTIPEGSPPLDATWPLRNVHLGVSVEDQVTFDERVPLLLDTPAAVRFLSCEPLLGPVDLRPALGSCCKACKKPFAPPIGLFGTNDVACTHCKQCYSVTPGVDGVIVGCESGPGARRMDLEWAERIMHQCRESHVPFMLKQAVLDGKLVKMPELGGYVWDQVARPRSVVAARRNLMVGST